MSLIQIVKELRWWLLSLSAVFIAGIVLGATPAHAQTGCEPTGDGPVDTQKSAVKKIGDTFTVRWTNPTQLADADCTPIDSDPAFALTGTEVYLQVGLPVPGGDNFPPVVTLPPEQVSFVGTLDQAALKPGENVYIALKACNQFGCSFLSNQPWMKIGGPPGNAAGVTVE